MSQPEASYISIARITRTQGLKGEVRIEQLLEEDLAFEPGRKVLIGEKQAEIEFFRRQHGRCVAKFKGIDTIDDAEKLIGSEVRVAADDLPEVEEGWFYTFQLKGCRVYTADGECIGEVTDVFGAGGTEILKVERGKEETLIPFAQEFLQEIDLDQRKIVVNLPEGLRELNK